MRGNNERRESGNQGLAERTVDLSPTAGLNVIRDVVNFSGLPIDSSRREDIVAEPLPSNGVAIWFVDATRAIPAKRGRALDPVAFAKDVGNVTAKARGDATRIAHGEVRTGLTTLPASDGLPAMNVGQMTGDGRGARDISAFLARVDLPQTAPDQSARKAVVLTRICRTPDVESAAVDIGYSTRKTSKKNKYKDKRR